MWHGVERTRAFREFRLLARAVAAGLPVPAPIAARIERTGGWYRADILLEAIENVATLAVRAAREAGSVPWAAIGQSIAAIHRAGIWHADLNAHNVLIGSDDRIWIVDFDRADYRTPDASWAAENLARLKRSLTKLGVATSRADFERLEWPALVAAHARALPAEAANAEPPRELRSANR
jgi:3-deoxy-D-manno-octulosonic acid kinase